MLDQGQLETALCRELELNGSVEVSNMFRIVGGASRNTWSFDATYTDNAKPVTRGLILREGVSTTYEQAIASDGQLEYNVLQALGGGSIPVPQVLFNSADNSVVGCEYFVMERVDGCSASVSALYSPENKNVAGNVVREMFRLAGELTRFDWRKSCIGEKLEIATPQECWKKQLDAWVTTLKSNGVDIGPAVGYAIRWLYENPPPPPARLSLLSGDFRMGNFLYDPEGEIKAWLDWEMAHLGDPVEDLTWALFPLWHRDGLPGGVAIEETIRIWEKSSGIDINPDAFKWWSIFQHVKASGLWQASIDIYLKKKGAVEPEPLTIAYMCPIMQENLLLRELGWQI